MRTTIALDDELVRQAAYYTGIKEKSALVREALTRLVRNEAARRLALLSITKVVGSFGSTSKGVRQADLFLRAKEEPSEHSGVNSTWIAILSSNSDRLFEPVTPTSRKGTEPWAEVVFR